MHDFGPGHRAACHFPLRTPVRLGEPRGSAAGDPVDAGQPA